MALYSLDFRNKKRRPWTSLDDEMGRGNLNCVRNGLILRSIFYLMVSLEYRLEYHRYWVDGVGGS